MNPIFTKENIHGRTQKEINQMNKLADIYMNTNLSEHEKQEMGEEMGEEMLKEIIWGTL